MLDALELLHAAPTAFAAAIRYGGGVREWLWKGDDVTGKASIEALINGQPRFRDLRYQQSLTNFAIGSINIAWARSGALVN